MMAQNQQIRLRLRTGILLLLVVTAAINVAYGQRNHYYLCSGDTFRYPRVYDSAFYRIDFGDGTADSGSRVIMHRFAGNGDYKLSIRRTLGSGIFRQTAIVHCGKAPTPGFTYKANCSQLEFINTIPDTIIPVNGWTWDFDDGASASEKSANHLFKKPGDYLVNLNVNGLACANPVPFIKKITVSLTPETGFDVHLNANNALFTPHKTNALSYYWDFGDHETTDSASPWHIYKNAGSYTVSLITISSGGCISAYQDTLSTTSAGVQPVNNNATVFQAYPNPFREMINIHYELTASHYVTLKLYDVSGRLAAIIQNGNQHSGVYNLEFHSSKAGLKSGIYLLKGVFGEVYLSQSILLQE